MARTLGVAQIETIFDPRQPALQAIDSGRLSAKSPCRLATETPNDVSRCLTSHTSSRTPPTSARIARRCSRTRLFESSATLFHMPVPTLGQSTHGGSTSGLRGPPGRLYQSSNIMEPRMSSVRIGYDTFEKTAPAAKATLLALGKAVDESGIDKEIVELVKLRVSQVNNCAFCLQIHLNVARRLGVTQEKLDLVASWHEAGIFSEKECAAL